MSLIFRPDEQQHEPAAAGAEQLAADRARLHGRVEQLIDGGVGDAIRERSLELPGLLQQRAELDEVGFRRRHDVDRLIHHLLHRPHVGRFALHVRDDGLGDLVRGSRDAGEHEHQMALQRVQPVWRQHDRRDAVGSILRDRDVIEAAKRGGHLILQPDTLAQHALLDVNRLVRQRLLRDVAAVERMNGVDQSHGERRARSEARAGRQIAVVMNLEALVDLEPLEHAAHGGMLNLADLLDVFDDGVDDAKAMVEERRQLADADVAVLVDGRRQHGAAVLAIPLWIIRSAPEK